MADERETPPALGFHPATGERWADLLALFGARGACGGCWCMWWRLPRAQWIEQRGDGNKQALERLARSGEAPGILAYADGKPIAWCSVSPREAFPALDRSRTLKRVDDQPVWSIVCFFVARPYRRRGLTVALLRAAVDYVRARGGRVVEGYPTQPSPGGSGYMGVTPAFLEAGFVEVARTSAARSIMRYYI
jgi:GNAT superfamily N-acetyltransferase